MNALSVGYRFTREELSTLLQALRIDGLPGAPLHPVDPAAAEATLRRIADSGLAMMVDGTLYVDKLIGYLLRAPARCKSAVAVTDGSHTAVLWGVDQLFILGWFPSQGECSLTPLQNREAARAELEDALCRLSHPVRGVNVFDPERRTSIPAEDLREPQQAAMALMALMDAAPDNQ